MCAGVCQSSLLDSIRLADAGNLKFGCEDTTCDGSKGVAAATVGQDVPPVRWGLNLPVS